MYNKLLIVAETLESWSERTGRFLAFTPLALILVQFTIVLLVSVFKIGSISLQESLQYINALMFLGGVGYTLKHNEHVRVDLFYSGFKARHKDLVDLFGTVFLLLPFVGLVWYATIPYISGSWANLERSVETSGLPFVYILKSTILLFALTLTIQAIANLASITARLIKSKGDA